MFLLIRHNSHYHLLSFLLGVFDSEPLAEKARIEYIKKREKDDPFRSQDYHTTDLKSDVTTSQLEELPHVIQDFVKIYTVVYSTSGIEFVSFEAREPEVEDFVLSIDYAFYELNRLYSEEAILPSRDVRQSVAAYMENRNINDE